MYESITDQYGSIVLGYFSPNDFYYRNTSNRCKAIYLAYNRENDSILATLAHEFQHLIYFNSKRINNNGNPNPKAYGIHGINLKWKYCNIQLLGYEIEEIDNNPFLDGYGIGFENIKRNTIRCFKKKANSEGKAIFNYFGNCPVSIYCFDERK